MANFFERIDTEEKAYLLGWIASDTCVTTQDSLIIQFPLNNRIILEKIAYIFSNSLLIKFKIFVSSRALTITSTEMIENVYTIFNIEPENKSKYVYFPRLDSEELTWAFMRGLFDGNGEISSIDAMTSPQCELATTSKNMKEGIKDFCKIKCSETDEGLAWYGNNAIDFLGKLYDHAKIYLPRKRELYLDWASWVPGLSGAGNNGRLKNFRWAKSQPGAFPPFKQRASDSGFDLTAIEMVEQIGDVQVYDTGIKVQPEYGWYFIIAPRSSLFKTGYIPAITTGIIDRTYVGSIKVPLIKFDKNAPDLQLPARIMQIIPTPIVHVEMVEVDDFEETNRSSSGLGSTGGMIYPKRE
jgi:dUTP pyrophosphatase